jgi:hypothetical protein
MKFIGVTCVLMLGVVLSACGGGGNSSGNINGTWTATLTNSDGSPAFAFTTVFTQSSGTSLTITNFSFSTSGSCFESEPVTETGSFGLTGDFNGRVSGTFAMTITQKNNPSNVLTLHGTVNNGVITGTWTLTGSVTCTGNGSFTATTT